MILPSSVVRRCVGCFAGHAKKTGRTTRQHECCLKRSPLRKVQTMLREFAAARSCRWGMVEGEIACTQLASGKVILRGQAEFWTTENESGQAKRASTAVEHGVFPEPLHAPHHVPYPRSFRCYASLSGVLLPFRRGIRRSMLLDQG